MNNKNQRLKQYLPLSLPQSHYTKVRLTTFLGARIKADGSFLEELLASSMSLSHQSCTQQFSENWLEAN